MPRTIQSQVVAELSQKVERCGMIEVCIAVICMSWMMELDLVEFCCVALLAGVGVRCF